MFCQIQPSPGPDLVENKLHIEPKIGLVVQKLLHKKYIRHQLKIRINGPMRGESSFVDNTSIASEMGILPRSSWGQRWDFLIPINASDLPLFVNHQSVWSVIVSAHAIELIVYGHSSGWQYQKNLDLFLGYTKQKHLSNLLHLKHFYVEIVVV